MTSLDDLPLRDDLRGKTPYGAPQKAVRHPLNVNENSHPIPEVVAQDVVTALAEAVLHANRYPDREFSALRDALAGYLSRELAERGVGAGRGHGRRQSILPEQLWAANGSNEVLQHVLQAFGGPGRTALGFPPTYSMHPIITESTGTTWVTASRDEHYTISPETAVAAIESHRPDIVFFCTPNNPTGTPVALETIAAAYEASDGILIVDEAYLEFAPDATPSAVTLLPGRERLVVSRTMSKAFAFAGVRLGYLAADPAVIDALRLVRLPYHLSALTQAAATAALGRSELLLETVHDIRLQRDRLLAALPGLGYSVHPSEANFVLFGGVADPPRLLEQILEHDILIRDVGIPGHLRVTAGTAEETDAFLAALREIGRA